MDDREASALLKNGLEEKFCMANDRQNCKGSIVNAHTVSKRYLKNIAVEGHVISPEGSIFVEDGRWTLKEVGVNKTKGFQGFCSYHDDKLFRSFEKEDFSGTFNQIKDISYRAICRELYQKKCLTILSSKLLKKNPSWQNSQVRKEYISHNDRQIRDLASL